MPDPPGTMIVVNSHVLNDIASAVLGEHEAGVGTHLLRAIRKLRHMICITNNLMRNEYGRASEGYGPGLLLPALQELESVGVARHCRTGSLPNLEGIPKWHRTFFEESVRTRSRYFLTYRPKWLDLRKSLEDGYDLLVVTPEEYLHFQSL